MNCSPRKFAVVLVALAAGGFGALRAAPPASTEPDALVLKDGRVVRGLILKNTRDAVLLQQRTQEVSYPKSEIVRIRDAANVGMEDTKTRRPGSLPSWRTLANDLRSHDEIKTVVEIPATAIDTGVFTRVPYVSFRVNGNIELDIYGDPENPAGVEMGIYGSRSGNDELRKVLRSYLAGYLATRAEIAALYGIPFTGGIRKAGLVTVEITPKSAPDAYGAWWISLYNEKALAAARLDARAYAKLVRPESEVVGKNGEVIAHGWSHHEMSLTERMVAMGERGQVMLRGFFRDAAGNFRLLGEPAPAN